MSVQEMLDAAESTTEEGGEEEEEDRPEIPISEILRFSDPWNHPDPGKENVIESKGPEEEAECPMGP